MHFVICREEGVGQRLHWAIYPTPPFITSPLHMNLQKNHVPLSGWLPGSEFTRLSVIKCFCSACMRDVLFHTSTERFSVIKVIKVSESSASSRMVFGAVQRILLHKEEQRVCGLQRCSSVECESAQMIWSRFNKADVSRTPRKRMLQKHGNIPKKKSTKSPTFTSLYTAVQ